MVIISEQRMRNTNALRGRYCSSDVEYGYSSVFPGKKKSVCIGNSKEKLDWKDRLKADLGEGF